MRNIIETRIRVEKSKHKTEYFPEYCLEEKTWFGKTKLVWYGVCFDSSHKFGEAMMVANNEEVRYSLAWAKKVIDYQVYYWKQYNDLQEHDATKTQSYIEYP